MPLTIRTNGSSGSNLITASWFNDFLNLFTGVMVDQPITFKPNVTMQPINSAPGAATLALTTGTALQVGGYFYQITYVTSDGGETIGGAFASVTTTSGNQAVNLTAIPIGPTGTAKRNIYRGVVNSVNTQYVATLNDNTTTTYSDTTPDTSLGAPVPTQNTYGGSLVFKDINGNQQVILANSGAFIGDLILQALYYTTPAAPTLTLQAGSTPLGVGNYKYLVTFVSANGETLPGSIASVTTTTGNQQVNITNIPIGPKGTISRRIYRTKVGGSTFYTLTTITDNTTTTKLDTKTDAQIFSPAPPLHSTFGGSLIIMNSSGVAQLTIASDGNISGNLSASVPYGWNQTLGGSNQAILDMTPPDGPKHLQLLYTGDGTGNMAWRNVTDGITQMFWTPTGDLNINGSLILNNFTMSQPSGGYGYFNNFNASPYGFRFNSNGTVIAHLDNNATNTSVLLHSQQLGGSPDYAEIVRVDDDTLAPGTVICPSGTEDSYGDHWAACTHDDCPAALIISTNPSVTAGGRLIQTETNGVLDFTVDTDPHWKPLAVSGRVPVTIQGTKTDYSYRMAVVSAGNGQIRPATTGDTNILGYVSAIGVDGMGAALSSTQVLIMLR